MLIIFYKTTANRGLEQNNGKYIMIEFDKLISMLILDFFMLDESRILKIFRKPLVIQLKRTLF